MASPAGREQQGASGSEADGASPAADKTSHDKSNTGGGAGDGRPGADLPAYQALVPSQGAGAIAAADLDFDDDFELPAVLRPDPPPPPRSGPRLKLSQLSPVSARRDTPPSPMPLPPVDPPPRAAEAPVAAVPSSAPPAAKPAVDTPAKPAVVAHETSPPPPAPKPAAAPPSNVHRLSPILDGKPRLVSSVPDGSAGAPPPTPVADRAALADTHREASAPPASPVTRGPAVAPTAAEPQTAGEPHAPAEAAPPPQPAPPASGPSSVEASPPPSSPPPPPPPPQPMSMPFLDMRMRRMADTGFKPMYDVAPPAAAPSTAPPAASLPDVASAVAEPSAAAPLPPSPPPDIAAASADEVDAQPPPSSATAEHAAWVADGSAADAPVVAAPMPLDDDPFATLPRFDTTSAPGAPLAPPPLPAVVEAMPLDPVAYANEIPTEVFGQMEDGAADLLRPLLREWLSQNMPRIVEKALRIEVARAVREPPDGKH